jgi:hypothetical protein
MGFVKQGKPIALGAGATRAIGEAALVFFYI